MESLSGHLLARILEKLDDEFDRKSWRLSCKLFYSLEVDSRRSLRLFNVDLLQQILRKFTSIERLNLSFCTKITDESLLIVAYSPIGKRLRSLSLMGMGGFSVAGITALCQRCCGLLDVDLSCCSSVGALELAAVAQLSSLRKLNLTGCYLASDAGLGCLAAGCKKLEVLILKGCVGISDAAICLLASNCKELKTVDVSHTEVTDHSVKCLSSLTFLRGLNLSGCGNVGDAALRHIKTSLLELDLSRCSDVTSVGISYLAGRGIKSLNLCYLSPINAAVLEAIGKMNRLETLKLGGCDIFGDGLRTVASGCTQLSDLSLSKCRGLTDGGIASILSRCKKLRKLDLTCCRELTEKTVYSIAKSSGSLNSLKIEACNILTANNFASLTERCSCLEVLDLTDCSVSDAGLEFVAKCKLLKSLKLGFCEISDRGIRCIGKGCSDLVELDLYRSGTIGDAGVASIASGCLKLQVLILSYCSNISDASIVFISQLKQLQHLEVRGCKGITLVGLEKSLPVFRSLIELDLKHCSVGDPGMTTIFHRFPNLQQLNVSHCPIKDRGLMGISKLKCLQNLKLVHVGAEISMNNIALMLLGCCCLKKVKLLLNLKQALPKKIQEQLERRGCRLRWMQKPG